jgi:UDP-N-acetylglucosamine acyltransferase
LVPKVHGSAIVDPSAELADDVTIEAYASIGPGVKIGPGTLIRQGAIVEKTTLGRGNVVFPYACLGGVPQDKKYKGEATSLVLGDFNTVREHATISIGTEHGGGVTRVGDRNLFMASSHVGHDCQIGNDCVIANFAGLAGHCRIDDFAIVGGQAGIHQFVRVGTSVMIGGGSKVGTDVPPFTIAQGYPARLRGINSIGLLRRGVLKATISEIKKAYRTVFFSGESREVAIARVRDEHGSVPEVQHFVKFLLESLSAEHKRGFLRPGKLDENGEDEEVF